MRAGHLPLVLLLPLACGGSSSDAPPRSNDATQPDDVASETDDAAIDAGDDTTAADSITTDDAAPIDAGDDSTSPPDGARDAGNGDGGIAGLRYLRGVNAENFLVTGGWGKGYGPAQTTETSYAFLRKRGHRLVRLLIGWGLNDPTAYALQPKLSGPLDRTYVARLHQEVANLAAAGLVAVLDLHSSCRYPNDQASTVCGNGITIADGRACGRSSRTSSRTTPPSTPTTS